jgi:hypothetical protein
MRRDVLPAAFEVVAELGHGLERVADLLVGIEPAMQHAVVDGVRVPFDVSDKRHDGGLELIEDRLELIGRQSWFGPVEEGVVGSLLVAERFGDPLVELEVLLEVGGEQREVGLVSSLLPVRSRGCARVGDLGHELGRQLASLVVIAARDPHEAGVV